MRAANSILRRALLYVPGSSSKMLAKSQGLTLDCAIYDLEDSVTPALKAKARSNIRQLLDGQRSYTIRENAVRINSLQSGLALDDLTTILQTSNLDTLVVPKVNSAADLHFVSEAVQNALPKRQASASPIKILALIESAKALVDLSSVCEATPILSGLIFAAEDFALDLSITRTPSLTEFLFARSTIVTACRAYELPSCIDLVCTSFKGDNGVKALEEECLAGKGLGFNGKQCIHPSQIDRVQKCYSPSDAKLDWAMRIIVGDEKAGQQGKAAWTMDGSMIDIPVVGKAKAIVRDSEACGLDARALRHKWNHQEPE